MSGIKQIIKLGILVASLGLGYDALAEEPKKDFLIENPQKYLKEDKKVIKYKKEDVKHLVENPSFYITFSGFSEQYKINLGKTLQGILEDECDFVEYYLQDFGYGKDLVIRCYKERDDGLLPDWGVNLDTVCRVYTKVKSLLGIEINAWLITELSTCGVSSKKMSRSSAEELTLIMGNYLKNNKDRCEDWKQFIQQNYGPRGPAD